MFLDKTRDFTLRINFEGLFKNIVKNNNKIKNRLTVLNFILNISDVLQFPFKSLPDILMKSLKLKNYFISLLLWNERSNTFKTFLCP